MGVFVYSIMGDAYLVKLPLTRTCSCCPVWWLTHWSPEKCWFPNLQVEGACYVGSGQPSMYVATTKHIETLLVMSSVATWLFYTFLSFWPAEMEEWPAFFFVTGTLAQVCTWPPGVLRPSWRRTWQWQRDIVKQWSRRDTKQWLQSSLKLDVLRPPSNLSSWNMLIVAVQKMKRRVRKWARKLLSRNATRIMLWTWQDLVKTQIKCQRIWHQSWFRFS